MRSPDISPDTKIRKMRFVSCQLRTPLYMQSGYPPDTKHECHVPSNFVLVYAEPDIPPDINTIHSGLNFDPPDSANRAPSKSDPTGYLPDTKKCVFVGPVGHCAPGGARRIPICTHRRGPTGYQFAIGYGGRIPPFGSSQAGGFRTPPYICA